MKPIDIIKSPIKEELEVFNDFFSKEFKSDIMLVNLISNYILKQKGKQLRPILTLLSSKLNGDINNASYIAASLIEILHTATLVHDDVVDESYVRRNMFSVNALWKSKAAVLFGDYLLSRGMLISLKHKQYYILEIVSEAVKEMSEGELLQIQASRFSLPNEEVYFKVIRNKTASLFIACTASGCASTTNDTEKIDFMKKFGENLGIAFQIKDDLMDIDLATEKGKPSNNDLKEKKFTLPIILALKNAPNNAKNKIINILKNKKISTEDIASINTFIVQNNGINDAEALMNNYANNAIEILSKYPASIVKDAMLQLVKYSTSRNR